MECRLDHLVLNVEDEEKMIDFYSSILMFKPERLEEYRAGKAPFASVRMNADTLIDLFPKTMWNATGQNNRGHENLNHFCMTLSQARWEELLERLKANGVDIIEGPVSRWGARGDGTSVYFRDPDGNVIEARHYGNRQQGA